MNLFFILQSGIANKSGELMPPQAASLDMSYLDLALKGGWVMYPILFLSIVGVYIFVERYIAIKKVSKIDMNFMDRIKDYVHDGKIDAARALCQSIDNPSARMVDKGIQRIGRPLPDITAAIEIVGKLEIYKLEKGFAILATVSGAAPMLGFLGTVLGMVQTFYDMARLSNSIDISLLSNGIYIALITTVFGLIVGIPTYFAYNVLVAKVEEVVFRLEGTTSEFLDLLNEPAK